MVQVVHLGYQCKVAVVEQSIFGGSRICGLDRSGFQVGDKGALLPFVGGQEEPRWNPLEFGGIPNSSLYRSKDSQMIIEKK